MPWPVTFFPGGRTVHVDPGTMLLHAAVTAGALLDTPCGGHGTCGKCRVRLRAGHAPATGSDARLSRAQLDAGWRLACATPVTGPLEVEIPDAVPGSHMHAILTSGASVSLPHDPRPPGVFGVAFDFGTTTVAGTLFDLHTGRELETRAAMNRQIARGDDVISRIGAVRRDAQALNDLQRLAADTLNAILHELCQSSRMSAYAIREVVVAGNTAMQHLLLGRDPSPLGEAPFTPAFTDAQTVPAAELGLHLHPDATLTVFPQIGGFVGGDTVAGLLASRLDTLPYPALLVDVGTNGEIVLQHEGRLCAASTAAGPAFEGARIRQGMRAAAGAIDAVWREADDLACHVIGDGPAHGLCGSALVDAVAEGLRLGAIDTTGTLRVPDDASPDLARRFQMIGGEMTVTLAWDAAGESAVRLTQQDIRELQLASGAIRAGIETLLCAAGVKAQSLGSLLLAGGFGNTLRVANAMRIGLLPYADETAVRFIGNASLAGAKQALLAQTARTRAQFLRNRTEHIDLSGQPGFSDCFMEHMLFPSEQGVSA
ncbi:MAG TPA: ASKHA domain-containing protein [Kiritimatiellia bacterium]|nr:ASKHA domain-containing protein [Kiritimatiellia bacterium]HRU71248.1 ASKHA domain-containing protein [Kiritimatiellia bacterium]